MTGKGRDGSSEDSFKDADTGVCPWLGLIGLMMQKALS